MTKPFIPEHVLDEMWQFMLEHSVPILLEKKIKERDEQLK